MSDNDNDLMLISAVARDVNKSVSTIRQWEKAGLIRAVKTTGGMRLFRRGAVKRCLRALEARRVKP